MPESQTSLQTVADLWFQWTEVVQKIIDPRRVSGKVTPQQYRDLHSALHRACKDCDVESGPTAEKIAQIDRIIGPWVTYDSLTTADRRFLEDVTKQAGRLSRDLQTVVPSARGRKAARGETKRIGLLTWVLAFFVGLGAAAFILMGDASDTDLPIRYDIQRTILRAKFLLSRFSFLQIFGFVTIAILLIVGPLMYRPKKS